MRLSITFLIIMCLFQCDSVNKKQINEDFNQWYNKKIELPNLIKVFNLEKKLNSESYKFVSHIDFNCGVCLLDMKKWENYSREIEKEYNIDFVFYISGSTVDEIKSYIKTDSIFDPIIFLDKDDNYLRINEIPNDPRFSSFFVDENNQVKIIGNPFQNDDMRNLYQDFFRANL